MRPEQLIGLGYRLGSWPEKHGTADCFSLACTVVNFYGFEYPKPQRSWYRRLRMQDYSVFTEQLSIWGEIVTAPKIGAVALCVADEGYGLSVYGLDGWLNFQSLCGVSVVTWSPLDLPRVVEVYYPQKPSSVTSLD